MIHYIFKLTTKINNSIMEGEIVARHYKITEKLGKGAFGEIWKAVHRKTKCEFAIKFESINSKHQ